MQNLIEKEEATVINPLAPTGEQQPQTIQTNSIAQKYEQYSNIPIELRQKNNWVVHRNKVPYSVKTGQPDKNNPAEWATFEEAISAIGDYDGLGYRFSGDEIVGVDIDTCMNPDTGEISDGALHIIRTLDSYTEISPSGYGVHIFVRADMALPFHKKAMRPNGIMRIVGGKQKTPELEIYNNGRYFTMTGNIFGEAKPIAERSRELQAIFDLYSPKNEAPKVEKAQPATSPDVLKIMFASKNGAKIQALYNGDISSYPSHSEADQALCNHLCFYSGGDKSAIDSLFRQSGLMRPKWDEKHGADTYGNMTIQKAVDSASGYYNTPPVEAHTVRPPQPPQSTPTEWEAPIPFKSVDLPAFPVNELPVVIGDYVRAVAETTQTSPDMAATAALAVLALSLQGKFTIEGKKDWREPLNLYTMVVAPPAERKSAVMSHMTLPIGRFEAAENERIAPLIEQNKIDKAILLNRKKALEISKKFVDREKIRAISEEIAEFKEIKPCRLYCDDITPEKLASVLCDSGGKSAILSAEGGIFDMLAGRYSNGVNIDVFLKAHSGDSIRVDRQGRTSEYIANPAMTTLLFAQPNVIESIMSNGVFHGRGLCARFLYSIPNSTVGRRKFESRPIPEITADRYCELINTLLAVDCGDTPKIMTLSSKAYELLRDFAEEIEPMLIDELAEIADFAGKFIGATLRIAGLIYLAECLTQLNSNLLLSEGFMHSAIKIGRYYLEHAKAAYQLMGADKIAQDCKYILLKLQKSRLAMFKSRDIVRICRKFNTVDDAIVPLNRLCEYGYLRELQAKTWEVNPAAYEIKV